MKTNLSGFCLISLTFLLASCMLNLKKDEKGVNDLVPVSINDYSLSVPAYMTKTSALNEEASLQFQNIFKETYVIVIDEEKQVFIDSYIEAGFYDSTLSVLMNYASTQVQSTMANLEVIEKEDLSELIINGLPAAQAQIDGTYDGIESPISYFLTFVEGKKNLYMIMGWTMQTKKDKYKDTFRDMAKSFKLLDNAPIALE